jgi:hypothetical protein
MPKATQKQDTARASEANIAHFLLVKKGTG